MSDPAARRTTLGLFGERLWWAGAGLVLALMAYGAAGMIGGAIPANHGWHAPHDGVTIMVESNGVHVGLVVPVVAAGVDWRGWTPAADLGDTRYAGYDHLAIGWGDRDSFLKTPTWADVTPRTILAAAAGSDQVLIHAEHIPLPSPGDDERPIVLTPEQYRRLAAFIRASWVKGGARYHGYGAYDAFYAARGHYSAIRTCNAWTGDALRAAGVRVGAWTPFPVTVTGWF